MQEIDTVNNGAKAAVLYYCDRETLPEPIKARVQSSSNALFNQAGQRTIEVAKAAPLKSLWHFTFKDGDRTFQASATRIKTTGWFVIALQPTNCPPKKKV